MKKLFGKTGTWYEDLRAFPQWRRVITEPFDYSAVSTLVQKVKEKGGTLERQMNQINRDINQYRYRRDPIGTDHWKNPAEFFADLGGDCEDFAIAKYFTLLTLGYLHGDLEVVVVNDRDRSQLHAILAVKARGRIVILDNQLQFTVSEAVVERYDPLFGLQGDCWWRYA